MKILVYLEQRSGKLKPSSLEALSLAYSLSGSNAQNVTGVIIGSKVSSLCAEASGFGADIILTIEDPAYENYNVMNYAHAFEKAIKEISPDLVLGIASPLGRDLFPRLAARLDGALLTDLVECDATGGTKPLFAGKVLAKVGFKSGGVKFATLRPNVFPSQKTQGAATAKALSAPPPANTSLKTVEIRKGKSDKKDLTEAHRIISGGRSLASLENFKILFDCADVLQASVGASRAAVDSGYASHEMQVGQTGKTVNPSLYIACGLSGSIQHMAGMRTSKIIVAVNTDPEAPIYSITDYGIVADLFEVVPLLTKKLKTFL